MAPIELNHTRHTMLSAFTFGQRLFTTLLLLVVMHVSAARGVEATADGGVEIVADGAAKAVVVVSDNVDDRRAAELLCEYIAKSSGVRLAIKHETDLGADDGVQIHVGATDYVASHKLNVAALDGDGFFLDSTAMKPSNIVIAGPTSWGTEFGVCEFLERYVGVRWLFPSDAGEDVPKHASIRIPRERVTQEPAFVSRQFSGNFGAVQEQWERRNRMHGRVEFHHNLSNLFPPAKYGQTHPEFFPIKDGVRFIPPEGITTNWQPCFTAPGIVDEAVKNICEYFEQHPEATSYSLGSNDGGGDCEGSADCQCGSPKQDGVNFLGVRNTSDRYFTWCNRVVERVLKKYPDKFFGCLAYSATAQAPTQVKLHPRLIPFMTYDRMAWIDPEVEARGKKLTEQWAQASNSFGWYDYIYGGTYCLPRVYFHKMAEYYRYGHAKGVKAMYAESYANWGEGPKLYVAAKLQWNPEQDVDALLRDWYVRAVGEDAADDLAAYYAHWEDFWTRRILASDWFDKNVQFLTYHQNSYLYLLTEDEIHVCRQQLEAVLAKAKTPAQKARAQVFLRAFEYYELTALAYLADAHSLDKPVTTEAEALASLTSGVACCEMAQKRRNVALIELAKDPVLRHAIGLELTHDDHRPWMRKWGYRDVLAGTNWGTTALWRAFDWADNGTVHRQLVDLAQSAQNPSVREHARFMLLLKQKKLAPISEDPSFEAVNDGQAGPWEFTAGSADSINVVADGCATANAASYARAFKMGTSSRSCRLFLDSTGL